MRSVYLRGAGRAVQMDGLFSLWAIEAQCQFTYRAIFNQTEFHALASTLCAVAG